MENKEMLKDTKDMLDENIQINVKKQREQHCRMTCFIKELSTLSNKYGIYFCDLCHLDILPSCYLPEDGSPIKGNRGYSVEPAYMDHRWSYRRATAPWVFNTIAAYSKDHDFFKAKRNAYIENYDSAKVPYYCSLDTGDVSEDDNYSKDVYL